MLPLPIVIAGINRYTKQLRITRQFRSIFGAYVRLATSASLASSCYCSPAAAAAVVAKAISIDRILGNTVKLRACSSLGSAERQSCRHAPHR